MDLENLCELFHLSFLYSFPIWKVTDFDPCPAEPKKGSWLPPPRVVWTLRVSPGGTAGWCGTRSMPKLHMCHSLKLLANRKYQYDYTWHIMTSYRVGEDIWFKHEGQDGVIFSKCPVRSGTIFPVQSLGESALLRFHKWFQGRKIRSTSALDMFRRAPARCGCSKAMKLLWVDVERVSSPESSPSLDDKAESFI